MSDELLRVKPSPLPPINPVPEYLAGEGLAALYEDTMSVLQVPWMGVVTMAFAHYNTFYGMLWTGLRELAGSAEFVAACGALREAAEREAAGLGAGKLTGALRAKGFADRELMEIEDQIEIFSHGNMPYLLIATAARLLLEGHALSGSENVTPFSKRHGPTTQSRLTLIEAHHADASTRAVYEDIKATLGLPFVNTDYRALARWPSYFALAWNDLRPNIATATYREALERVHSVAVDLMREVPNPGALNPETLRAAAAQDGPQDEILSVVQLFQWLLPGLVVNVAYFRSQLS